MFTFNVIMLIAWTLLTVVYFSKSKEIEVPNWLVALYTLNLALSHLYEILK